MTYDSQEILANFHQEESLGYPMLRDIDVKHVTAWNVLNEQYGPDSFAYGVPHPGIFYVTPAGELQLKFAVPGYRQRPPLDDVLEAIKELQSGP